MKHKCQDKKLPPGTNCQGHQTHVQDEREITNPVQTHDETYPTHMLPVRTHDEAPLSMTPQRNSLATTLNHCLGTFGNPSRNLREPVIMS